MTRETAEAQFDPENLPDSAEQIRGIEPKTALKAIVGFMSLIYASHLAYLAYQKLINGYETNPNPIQNSEVSLSNPNQIEQLVGNSLFALGVGAAAKIAGNNIEGLQDFIPKQITSPSPYLSPSRSNQPAFIVNCGNNLECQLFGVIHQNGDKGIDVILELVSKSDQRVLSNQQVNIYSNGNQILRNAKSVSISDAEYLVVTYDSSGGDYHETTTSQGQTQGGTGMAAQGRFFRVNTNKTLSAIPVVVNGVEHGINDDISFGVLFGPKDIVGDQINADFSGIIFGRSGSEKILIINWISPNPVFNKSVTLLLRDGKFIPQNEVTNSPQPSSTASISLSRTTTLTPSTSSFISSSVTPSADNIPPASSTSSISISSSQTANRSKSTSPSISSPSRSRIDLLDGNAVYNENGEVFLSNSDATTIIRVNHEIPGSQSLSDAKSINIGDKKFAIVTFVSNNNQILLSVVDLQSYERVGTNDVMLDSDCGPKCNSQITIDQENNQIIVTFGDQSKIFDINEKGFVQLISTTPTQTRSASSSATKSKSETRSTTPTPSQTRSITPSISTSPSPSSFPKVITVREKNGDIITASNQNGKITVTKTSRQSNTLDKSTVLAPQNTTRLQNATLIPNDFAFAIAINDQRISFNSTSPSDEIAELHEIIVVDTDGLNTMPFNISSELLNSFVIESNLNVTIDRLGIKVNNQNKKFVVEGFDKEGKFAFSQAFAIGQDDVISFDDQPQEAAQKKSGETNNLKLTGLLSLIIIGGLIAGHLRAQKNKTSGSQVSQVALANILNNTSTDDSINDSRPPGTAPNISGPVSSSTAIPAANSKLGGRSAFNKNDSSSNSSRS